MTRCALWPCLGAQRPPGRPADSTSAAANRHCRRRAAATPSTCAHCPPPRPNSTPRRRTGIFLALALAAVAAAVAQASPPASINSLALALLPTTSFSIQSAEEGPSPPSDYKLVAYCRLRVAQTPGLCTAKTTEGDFAR